MSGTITEGHLLGGRVRHDQPATGFRSGIEPVLLAAAIPARSGQAVLEGGSGAGAGLLCLAARVAELRGLGIEQDPALAALAGANAAANGFAGLAFAAADLLRAAPAGPFDHVFANPPYHRARGTPPAEARRIAAKRVDAAGIAAWVAALARPLRRRGTLSLILGMDGLAEALAALAPAHLGSVTVLPLWPRAGAAAKLAILRAVKEGRATPRLLGGLVLHAADGRFTPEAEAVLRGGAALSLDG